MAKVDPNLSSFKAQRLILASKSPYRKALLEGAGFPVTIIDAQVDESSVVGVTPKETAILRALAKGEAVARQASNGSIVIGADQVVGFQGKVLDKAVSADEARQRITALQGQVHVLHSAMTLILVGEYGNLAKVSWCIDVPMAMRPLTEQEIEAYLATGEWEGSVGCYKYEKVGSQLFELKDSLGSDQSAIIGLPLPSLGVELRKLGVNTILYPNGPWDVRLPAL